MSHKINNIRLILLIWTTALSGLLLTAQDVPVLDWYYSTKGSGSLKNYYPSGIAMDHADNIIVGAIVQDIVDLSIEGPPQLIGQFGENGSAMVKYSSDGEILWFYPTTVLPRIIKVDSANNIYIAGAFTGQVNFDFKGGSYLVNSQQNLDAFLAKYTPDGDLLWAFSFPGTGYSAINDISIHEPTNTLSIVGAFRNQVEMNPDPNESLILDIRNGLPCWQVIH